MGRQTEPRTFVIERKEECSSSKGTRYWKFHTQDGTLFCWKKTIQDKYIVGPEYTARVTTGDYPRVEGIPNVIMGGDHTDPTPAPAAAPALQANHGQLTADRDEKIMRQVALKCGVQAHGQYSVSPGCDLKTDAEHITRMARIFLAFLRDPDTVPPEELQDPPPAPAQKKSPKPAPPGDDAQTADATDGPAPKKLTLKEREDAACRAEAERQKAEFRGEGA